jgi:hypothetical protein
MTGGDLHWIWKPYALYATVDYVGALAVWFCSSSSTLDILFYRFMAFLRGSLMMVFLLPKACTLSAGRSSLAAEDCLDVAYINIVETVVNVSVLDMDAT